MASRSIFVTLTLLAVLILPSTPLRGQEPGKAPSFLVVMADDLGYSDIGSYGGEIDTPVLDRLAREGLRFTNFYNTARCWPTRAALLTGYYAQQVRRDRVPGVKSGGGGSRPSWAPLIPAILAKRGYRTYHSGKWHVDGMPLEGGFHRSYYLKDQSRFFNPQIHHLDDRQLPPVEKGTGFYGTTAIADHAVKVLTEHARDHASKPFFHYLAFTAPHFPLHALEEDIERYRGRYREGWEVIRERRAKRQVELGLDLGEVSDVERDLGPPYHLPKSLEILGEDEVNRPLRWEKLTESQREFQARKMELHAAMVDRMDRELGRVIEVLEKTGLKENTLILFLSDNGASAEIMVRADGHDPAAAPGSAETYLCLGPGWSTVSNTPFRRHKTWTHEGGTATPLIASWPAGIRDAGKIRETVGHVVDLWPTLLELAGVEDLDAAWRRHPRPGRSLVGSFRGDSAGGEERTLWWLHEGHRALRRGDWKVVEARDSGWELYHLGRDRTEMHDLARQNPDRLASLTAAWESLWSTFQEQARASGN